MEGIVLKDHSVLKEYILGQRFSYWLFGYFTIVTDLSVGKE